MSVTYAIMLHEVEVWVGALKVEGRAKTESGNDINRVRVQDRVGERDTRDRMVISVDLLATKGERIYDEIAEKKGLIQGGKNGQ